MNPTDLGDATARALQILPPSDPANTDPRLVRDPQLAEEIRQAAETAAAVWLAVSPLRVAPPGVLREVMKEIQTPTIDKPSAHRNIYPLLAATGWAAAAIFAIISLWPKRHQPTESRDSIKNSAASSKEVPESDVPSATPAPRDTRLRNDIVRLQDRLTALQNEPSGRTPRVMTLSAPGAARRTDEESQRHVQKLLTDALRSALEASSGAPSDPATLVIERGWLPGGIPMPGDGMIRHRNFPEKNWQEYGLLRAENGDYLDTASQTVWSPDPEGRGFIGRKLSRDEDVSHYTEVPAQQSAPPNQAPAPEGFVIENPAEKTTEIFVENLPEIPPGGQLILATTDTAGITTTIPLTQSLTGEIGAFSISPTNLSTGSPLVWGGGAIRSTSVTSTGSGVSTANTFSPSSNTSFTSNIVGYLYGGSLIVSFPSDAVPAEVQLAIGNITPTGQPPQVIVRTAP